MEIISKHPELMLGGRLTTTATRRNAWSGRDSSRDGVTGLSLSPITIGIQDAWHSPPPPQFAQTIRAKATTPLYPPSWQGYRPCHKKFRLWCWSASRTTTGSKDRRNAQLWASGRYGRRRGAFLHLCRGNETADSQGGAEEAKRGTVQNRKRYL